MVKLLRQLGVLGILALQMLVLNTSAAAGLSDTRLFAEAKQKDSVKAYRAYQQQCSRCVNYSESVLAIARINASTDAKLFSKSTKRQSVDALNGYLKNCTSCEASTEAVIAIENLGGETAFAPQKSFNGPVVLEDEEATFQQAKKTNRVNEYQRYVRGCKTCAHYSEAVSAISQSFSKSDSESAQLALEDKTLASLNGYLGTCKTCAAAGDVTAAIVAQNSVPYAAAESGSKANGPSDEALLQNAKLSNTIESWQTYMQQCDACVEYSSAITTVNQLLNKQDKQLLPANVESAKVNELSNYLANCTSCTQATTALAKVGKKRIATRKIGNSETATQDNDTPSEDELLATARKRNRVKNWIAYQHACERCDAYDESINAINNVLASKDKDLLTDAESNKDLASFKTYMDRCVGCQAMAPMVDGYLATGGSLGTQLVLPKGTESELLAIAQKSPTANNWRNYQLVCTECSEYQTAVNAIASAQAQQDANLFSRANTPDELSSYLANCTSCNAGALAVEKIVSQGIPLRVNKGAGSVNNDVALLAEAKETNSIEDWQAYQKDCTDCTEYQTSIATISKLMAQKEQTLLASNPEEFTSKCSICSATVASSTIVAQLTNDTTASETAATEAPVTDDKAITDTAATEAPAADDEANTDTAATEAPTADDEANTDTAATEAPAADDEANTDTAATEAPAADDEASTDTAATEAPTADDEASTDTAATEAPAADDEASTDTAATEAPAADDKASTDTAVTEAPTADSNNVAANLLSGYAGTVSDASGKPVVTASSGQAHSSIEFEVDDEALSTAGTEAELQVLQEDLASVRSELALALSEKNKLAASIEPLKQRVQDVETQLGKARLDLNETKTRLTHTADASNESNVQLRLMSEKLAAAGEANVEQQATIDQLRSQLSSVTQQASGDQAAKETLLTNTISQQAAKIAALTSKTSELTSLQEELATAKTALASNANATAELQRTAQAKDSLIKQQLSVIAQKDDALAKAAADKAASIATLQQQQLALKRAMATLRNDYEAKLTAARAAAVAASSQPSPQVTTTNIESSTPTAVVAAPVSATPAIVATPALPTANIAASSNVQGAAKINLGNYRFNASNIKPIATFAGHNKVIWDTALSNNGRYVASASDDQTVRLWDLRRGATRVLKGHTAAVNSVTVSPRNRTLATASSDGTVRIWAALTGTHIGTLKTGKTQINTAAYSADGKLVALGADDGEIQLWNVITRTQLNTFQGHRAGVTDISFSPDGSEMLTTGLDRKVKRWSTSSWQQVGILNMRDVMLTADYSADSQTLVTGSNTGNVILWDRDTGSVKSKLKLHKGSVNDAYITGNTLVSAGEDNRVVIANANTGKVLNVLEGTRATFLAGRGVMVTSANGRRVALYGSK